VRRVGLVGLGSESPAAKPSIRSASDAYDTMQF
jgi:hypothetical protein